MLFIHIYVVYIFMLPCCKVNSFWPSSKYSKLIENGHKISHFPWWMMVAGSLSSVTWELDTCKAARSLEQKVVLLLQKSLVALHNTPSEICLNYTKRCNANRTWRRIATTQPVMLNHAFLYLLLKITVTIVFSEFFPQFNLSYGGFFNI